MPLGEVLRNACALVRAGNVNDGIDALERVRGRESELAAHQRALLIGTLLECRLARGDLAPAMALGDDLSSLLDGVGLAAALAHHARGELAAALGHPEVAVEHFTRAGVLAPEATADELPWRGGAALAHLRAGNTREAADLAKEHLAAAQAEGSPYALASALRTMAVVDYAHDRTQHLLRARAVLAGTRADRLLAQINTDLAGLLILSHDASSRDRALTLLRTAEEHTGRQELWPLQSRIRRLLDRLDERPRKVETEAIAALTISEQRVARMAADGLTNRQIANELVVTVKAVEWHLSHVYRKLGISSRTHLPGTLGVSA
jgi:ATP/maltotriose-dependent transcriptional regulator MalT